MPNVTEELARRHFRVLTRTRGGYNGSTMYDVQLQSIESGALLWAQTFTDADQADDFENHLEHDLELPSPEFRRKYGVPASQ